MVATKFQPVKHREAAMIGRRLVTGLSVVLLVACELPAVAGGKFHEVQRLTASDGPPHGRFGESVSLSGDRAIIGDSSGSDGGAAYIFERDGGGNWGDVQKLTASDGEQSYFGESVSLSGDWAIIGHGPLDVLAAYVFERDGSGHWSEVQKLHASDGQHGLEHARSYLPAECGCVPLPAASALDANGLALPDQDGNALASNVLSVAAVRDANGDGVLDYTGNGDEDGDGLTDYFETCILGSDPCDADSDNDGLVDGDDADPLYRDVQGR